MVGPCDAARRAICRSQNVLAARGARRHCRSAVPRVIRRARRCTRVRRSHVVRGRPCRCHPPPDRDYRRNDGSGRAHRYRAGILAGLGWLGLAAGGGAILVLVLREKERLHWLVQRLDEREIRAGVQFAVLSICRTAAAAHRTILHFGVVALEPRALWAIVLLFSALNFAGFVARRVVGALRRRGSSRSQKSPTRHVGR